MIPRIAGKRIGGKGLALAAFLLAFAILAIRTPDALGMPQFWAEDGAVWYEDAHEHGAWRPFLMTQDGYFSTYLRVVGAAAQALPLSDAPLFFAIVGLAVQSLPAAFFLSSRFEPVMPGRKRRALLALLYLLLPNTAEIRGNATNAQWFLALLAFMAVVSAVPRTKAGRIADIAVVVLAGLSGPYAIFLAPLAYWTAKTESDRWRTLRTALLASCAVIQLSAMFLLNAGDRFGAFPAFDGTLLYRILEKQVFVSALIGPRGYAAFLNAAPTFATVLFAMMTVAGIALVAYAARRGPLVLRLFLAFAGMSLAASLAAPNIGPAVPASGFSEHAWQVLLTSSSGSRYWFLPMLAFLSVLCWALVSARMPALRLAAAILLGFLPAGLTTDFVRNRMPDTRFASHVSRYRAASPGEKVVIPVLPLGWGQMTLTKR